MGLTYIPKVSKKDFSIGKIGIGVKPETGKLFVSNTAQMNAFGKALGYKEGDIILQLNDIDLPENLTEMQNFFDETRKNMKEGAPFSVTVLRTSEEGEESEERLETEIFKVISSDQHKLEINENATDRQNNIRKAWLVPTE